MNRGGWQLALSLAAALLLDTLVLPGWLALAWPHWLLLMTVYWCLRLPQRVGIASAWALGLLSDLTRDALLGQHALAFTLVAFLVLQTRRRLRPMPAWQQALTVLLFTLLHVLLLSWLDGMSGHPPDDFLFLLPVLSTLLAWPLIVNLLDRTP